MEDTPEAGATTTTTTMTMTNNTATSTTNITNTNNNTSNNASSNGNHDRSFYLRWSRLQKTVQVKAEAAGILSSSISTSFKVSDKNENDSNSNKKDDKIIILNSVSGAAAPGQVLAIMGPSGSGKTSLMNVLSGRSAYEQGVISINGQAVGDNHDTNGHSGVSMKRLMSKVAYVKQADVFFGHLTVRDQLTYTALLRMPSHFSKQEKCAEVDRILTQLRLQHVADSQIYLISGGEKKRVNIGTELLTDPVVLMLDEPTSGLDSTSAVSLLRMLQLVAKKEHKTVITSIHQPSSAVFRSFDQLLMLSAGHVVYFGTPAASMSWLRQSGFSCPDGYNAADHWMDLLVQDAAVEEERREAEADADAIIANDNNIDEERPGLHAKLIASPRFLLQDAWDNEAVAVSLDQELVGNNNIGNSEHTAAAAANKNASNNNTTTANMVVDLGTKYNTSWATQYYILTHRALKNSRSAIFTTLNLIKSVAIGVIAGLLWFQIDYTEQNVNDIRSYYFFTMTFWVFDSMFTALTAFPSEREVILKERASGSYHLSAYFMAKSTADGPVRLILPFLYMIVSYWMAGIDDRISVFIGTIGCTLLSVLAGEAIGLFIGAAIYDLQKAITVMTVNALALMLLGGFFVENVPSFVSWGKFLSPFKYAFDSSLQLVFDRDIPCDGSGALEELCGGRDTGVADAAAAREFIGIQGSIGFNVGMLLVISFLPRYGAYVALRMKKGGERS
jgi:ABC-type multidrug transport system ATPase subunit